MQFAVQHNQAHPMELKKGMAQAVIARFWSTRRSAGGPNSLSGTVPKKRLFSCA